MSTQALRSRGGALLPFFVLTFAFTWGLAAFAVLFPGPFAALFGKISASNPIFVLAVAAPTITATILTAVGGGRAGLRALYARLIQWRFGLRWYAVLLVGIPLAGFLASRVAGPEPHYNLSTPALLLSLLLLELILGPLGEEVGWRGFALPRLLQRFNPLLASLTLGVIWGVWHLPAFVLSGLPQSSLALPLFLGAILGLSILATWIFLHTGGSLLSMVLFHFMVNSSVDVFGTPLSAETVVVAVVAALVLVLDRTVGWVGDTAARGVRSASGTAQGGLGAALPAANVPAPVSEPLTQKARTMTDTADALHGRMV